jgi:hypothetical protein
MTTSTSFAQMANNQSISLSSALRANTPPTKGQTTSRKFLTSSIFFRFLLVMFLTLTASTAWGAHTVVKASEMVSGEKYIITAQYNGTTYYLKPASFSAGGSSAVAYTTNLTDAAAWTFTKSNNIWNISTVVNGTTCYLGHNDTNNGVKSVNPKNNGDYSIVASTSGASTVKMTANDRDLALYQGSNWRCYSSNSGVKTITLYKVESATPSLTATPTSLAFGTVEKGSYVAAKTFSISGSNLTNGTLTITTPVGYSVPPTPIPVNGTLSATHITVTPNTSTAGTFNGNITISGGGLTSSVTVALTMIVKEKHTVTWSVDGSTTTERVFEDAKPTTPPTISTLPCGEVFVGWTDAENGNYTHDTSNLYKTIGEIPAITEDKTFYAVFADYVNE